MPQLLCSESREIESRVAECSAHAFRAAYSVLQNYADAEDITQDALVKAYQSLSQLREIDRIHSWVARIAWRLALNKLRLDQSRLRREALTSCDTGDATTAIDYVVMNDNYHRLRIAINGLPPQFRIVALLVGIEEHSVRDVAQQLNVPEGTVKSRLHRARRMLKRHLQ